MQSYSKSRPLLQSLEPLTNEYTEEPSYFLLDPPLGESRRLKGSESCIEYGEMNITTLNHRIDDIEDEIVREKLKIQEVNGELNDTFEDIFTKY